MAKIARWAYAVSLLLAACGPRAQSAPPEHAQAAQVAPPERSPTSSPAGSTAETEPPLDALSAKIHCEVDGTLANQGPCGASVRFAVDEIIAAQPQSRGLVSMWQAVNACFLGNVSIKSRRDGGPWTAAWAFDPPAPQPNPTPEITRGLSDPSRGIRFPELNSCLYGVGASLASDLRGNHPRAHIEISIQFVRTELPSGGVTGGGCAGPDCGPPP